MDKKDKIKSFADKRPLAKAVFGYGSGVFKQSRTSGTPQTDVIFVVDDIMEWHRDNMCSNSGDYSLIGKIHLSTDNIDRIKGRNFITYFSDVKDGDMTFKYGVVEEDDFNRGLSTWDNLFLVGRFHKPVLDVISDGVLRNVISKNRDCAFRIACLLSNQVTDKESVYRMLCSLSYMGDVRMKIAEDPHKVESIVKGSFNNFERIYTFNEPYVRLFSNGDVLINHSLLLYEIEKLPSKLVDYLAELGTDLSDLDMVRRNILRYIVEHNKKESRAQIVEGIKTNGVVRSTSYALRKVMKKIGK